MLEWIIIPFSRNLSNSGIEPRSLVLQVDFFFFFFLPSEPPGKSFRAHYLQVFLSTKAARNRLGEAGLGGNL